MARTQNLSAILMFITVLAAGSVLFGIVRHLSEGGYHAFQLFFFYCVVALVAMLPWAYKHRAEVFKSTGKKLYWVRALLEFLSFSLSFYALSLIPLPSHTALSFITPIVGSVTAVVILKEKPTHHTWIGLLLGIIGVFIITRPGSGLIDPIAIVIMLVSATAMALCGVSIKLLTRTESPTRVAFFMLLLTALVALPFAVSVWKPIEMTHVPWILGIGLCALCQQVLIAKAIQRVPLTTVIPLNFLSLVFTSIIAYFFFNELVDTPTILGAAIIIMATFYSTYGATRYINKVRSREEKAAAARLEAEEAAVEAEKQQQAEA
ncbi:MAG: hypothetical protein CMM94_03580 [Rickettsiales bacterium]|nr:hypothetical protein [Rickettsiales bacterium]